MTQAADKGRRGQGKGERVKGVARVAHARRGAPYTALDAYLIERGWTNATFARLVRSVRRHPTSPGQTTVSAWRHGRLVPSHDARLFIEIASKGEVKMDAWPVAAKSAKAMGKCAAR